jgi:hypothetical protein
MDRMEDHALAGALWLASIGGTMAFGAMVCLALILAFSGG